MDNKTAYKKIAEQHRLPLFFQPWWLDMVSDNWDVIIVEDEKGVQAVWPFTIEKKIGVLVIRNPLMTPYLGPYFFLDKTLNPNKRLSKEDKIYKSLWEQIPTWGFFEVMCLPEYNNFLPFHQKGFTHTQRITYRIDLSNSEETLHDNIFSKQKYSLRQTSDLTVFDGMQYLDQLYHFHKETLERKGKKYPYTKEFFNRLIQTNIEHNSGVLKAALDADGKVAAMVFTVCDHTTMYLLISATNTNAIHNGAVALLIWQSILHAKKSGLKIFDFEGSMDKGIELFFRSFGGERKTYLHCTSNRSTLWKLKNF